MTFKELCELVAEEVNDRYLAFSTASLSSETDPFKRKVIRNVQKAHLDIALFSRHWRFLHYRGTILALRAEEDEYYLPNVESIDYDSLYLTKSGSTARWPIYEESYEVWKQRERSQNTADAIPSVISRGVDPDKWFFWPPPSEAYSLNGDLRWKVCGLEKLSDVPLWDEEFHDLISDLAIRRLEGRVRTQDEIVSGLNTKVVVDGYNSRWDTFCARYLPELEGARSLF